MCAAERQNNPLNRWRHDPPGVLVEEWMAFLQKDPGYAYELINDPSLEFPVIYLLKDQLHARGSELDSRVRIALAHVSNVLHGADLGLDESLPFADQHDKVVGSLLWVLQTGWKNILSTDYAQVIDLTAIEMLHTYHYDWLKEMTDLIVYRYKNKSQRHYLISALLETANPHFLVYLANYLLSDQNVENEFARKMLGFIPEIRHAADNQAAFFAFESWYEKNEHYLVYTGETNDAIPGGRPFRIHHSAKYLGKAVNPKSGEPIQAMLATEKDNYQQFIRLPDRSQISLSVYSADLRNEQPQRWRHWMNQPLSQQLTPLGMTKSGGELG
ncbi:MAG: hypothetical protein ABF651_00170 [Sporolactobacillus sp.]